MNQKLIFNIIIAIILTAVLAFFALVLLNDEQQLDPQNNPDSIVPSNPVNTSIQTNQTNNNQGVSGFSVVGDQLSRIIHLSKHIHLNKRITSNSFSMVTVVNLF